MEIESVGSVLKKEGHKVYSGAPDATVYDTLALMAAKDERGNLWASVHY
jgi:hypothetical protein